PGLGPDRAQRGDPDDVPTRADGRRARRHRLPQGHGDPDPRRLQHPRQPVRVVGARGGGRGDAGRRRPLRRLQPDGRRLPPEPPRHGRRPAGRQDPVRATRAGAGLQLGALDDAPAELPRPAAAAPLVPARRAVEEVAALGGHRDHGRHPPPSERNYKMQKHVLAAVLAVAAAGFLAAVAVAAVNPPPTIKSAGKIVFCTDATYPPEESLQGTTFLGSDIDIADSLAAQMGVKAVFKNTTFDSIIAALKSKKCDAIISGMNDTADRRKQVDFVDYLKVGQSIMVKAGNPKHITKLADLAGKSVSVESGTTDRDFLASASTKLTKQGKKAINIKTFPKDTDAAAALKAGRVDAYFGDSPVVVYYANRDKSFAIGGAPIAPIAIGIAVRKGDPLKAATQKAVNSLYANGSLKKIVAKWGMSHAVTFLK